jgi:outer membrane protein assembly factor BamE
MRLSLPIILLLTALIAGCNLLYKQDIPQGTLLSVEMLAALKPAMTKRQVRLLLGSPPVTDTFRPERWDYVYSVSKAGEPVKPQRLTLYFRNDTLVRAEGDLAPAVLIKPANGNGEKSAPGSNGANAPR